MEFGTTNEEKIEKEFLYDKSNSENSINILPSTIFLNKEDGFKFEREKIKKIPLDLSPVVNTEKLAFLLENVFTPAECRALVDLCETVGAGYTPAKDSRRDTGQDKFSRVVAHDPQFAHILLDRIEPFLPTTFKGRPLLELNERFQFLRYDPGHQFAQHYDGPYVRPDKTAGSLITLQIYLNDNFEGGHTTFLFNKGSFRGEGGGGVSVPVVPKTGMVLVFEHRILHEGSRVIEGRKYSVRTDVLYATRGTETTAKAQSLD